MQESENDRKLNDAQRQQVSDALEAILSTEKFEAAPQMSAFLRYVVEEAAQGNQSRIKAFTVAVDALGKPDTFDPQNDPVVRVLAGRLRATLASYNDENPEADLIITMRPGSYVPSFIHRESAAGQLRMSTRLMDDTADQVVIENTVDTDRSSQDDMTESETLSSAFPDNTSERFNADSVSERSEYVDQNTGKSSQANDSTFEPAGYLDQMVQALSRSPKRALAAVLLLAAALAFMQTDNKLTGEPDLKAASLAATDNEVKLNRDRPELPSIFVSTINSENVLENGLNAIISGVISENNGVNAYRMMGNGSETRFWPEDYILTLTTLDLPDETRVSMQLMEAATGKIIQSDAVRLNERAFEQITSEELAGIIETAESIVSDVIVLQAQTTDD